MWTMWMLAAASAGQMDEDVARGWYLWNTGQSEAAYEVADAIGLDGAEGPALPFVIGMGVDRGNGPSLEGELRDRWSEDRNDPGARIALALALTLRRQGEGLWCQEASTLLEPIKEGIDRYWAAKADMERERRCVGSTEHAEAELRRIAKAGDGPSSDAVFGTLRAGYFKDGFPKQLEAALEEQPHRVAEAGVAWSKRASGPAVMGTRKFLNRALDAAMESGEPSLVYAALLGYRGAEKDKPAAEAEELLASLDAAADTTNMRSLSDVHDPEAVEAIDSCTQTATSLADGVACLRGVNVPEGSIEGLQQHLLRVLLEQDGKPDEGYEAGRAAYQADPTNRLYATVFAQRALARGEDLELAVEAAEAVLADRMPEEGEQVPAALAPKRAAALDVLAALEALTGSEAEGLEHMLLAVALEDTAARRHRLGHALAAAERIDDAVITLLRALQEDVDDSALVGESRRLLAEHLGDWHPGGLKGALAELDGDPPADHPLVGKSLPTGVLPPEASTEIEEPEAVVVALWEGNDEASASALVRWEGIAKTYGERGVAFHLVDVGAAAGTLPDDLTLKSLAGSPSTLRAVQVVSVPTVVVVNGKGKLEAVLAGYDSGGLDLEKALDEFLPEEE